MYDTSYIDTPMDGTPYLDKLDNAVCFSILSAIAEIPKNFGYVKTIGFLRGSKSNYIIRNELHKNSFYGCFSMFSKSDIETIIEHLYKQACLEIEYVGNFNRQIIVVSKFGLRVLGGREDISFKSGIFIKKDLIIDNKYLYQDLKELRYKLARKEQKPAFMICSNESLINIVNKKPLTKEELLKIKGIGKVFIDNYADKFFEILRNT